MDEFRDAIVTLLVLVSLVAEVRRPLLPTDFLVFDEDELFFGGLSLDGDGLRSTFAWFAGDGLSRTSVLEGDELFPCDGDWLSLPDLLEGDGLFSWVFVFGASPWSFEGLPFASPGLFSPGDLQTPLLVLHLSFGLQSASDLHKPQFTLPPSLLPEASVDTQCLKFVCGFN